MTRRVLLATSLLLATSCGLVGTKTFTVPSASMEPSIRKGDTIRCSTKVPARVARGSVVVFHGDAVGTPGATAVKRVVGLPGESVAGDERGVTVGGTLLPEPYAMQDGMAFGPVTVPEGSYFLLGDNRARSSDSRVNGTVPRSALDAVCTRIAAPRDHRGRIPGT